MHSKRMGLLAVLFAAILIVPIVATAFADVYVPPGPTTNGDMSEWIAGGRGADGAPTPSLQVLNMNASYAPIGWMYSDGPMYNVTAQTNTPKVEWNNPYVLGPTSVGFGTAVMVLGFIPGVTVSMLDTPPAIELTITWNGVPDTVTIAGSQQVGATQPPVIPALQRGAYEAAFPGGSINKIAKWQVYYGPWSSVVSQVLHKTPAAWMYKYYGLFFWYEFKPNCGDYISYNCNGKVMDPPTYDITALFEYGTSQIWYNHICFNVDFLQIHKTVTWENGPFLPTSTVTSAEADDVIYIYNAAYSVPATGLQLVQTFPTTDKIYILPWTVPPAVWGTLTNPDGTTAYAEAVTNFAYSTQGTWFTLQKDFSTLAPGQTLTIAQNLEVKCDDPTTAPITIVFDSMCAANEIPAWKQPLGLYALTIGSTPTSPQSYLWSGMELLNSAGVPPTAKQWATLGHVNEWPVYGTFIENRLTEGAFGMTLDPLPVSLSGGSTITSADVNQVRQVIVGSAPFDSRMDLTASGSVNLLDLAAYKAAAGQ